MGRSVLISQYILLLTLISYTPLRYVRNVAHEEYKMNIADGGLDRPPIVRIELYLGLFG